MKPKTTILMVLAIGCGLAAAFMTNKLIADRNKDAPEVEKVTVLVAKKKISAMTFIKKVDEYFEPQERSKNGMPGNVLNSLDDKDLKDGFRVSKPFSEGGFLTRDDLISKEMEGLATKVPPGMRAVAVQVTAVTLAGGFVLPGSKVDLLWTYRTTSSHVGALTILQDVLVLAVDTTSARNPESPQTILGATVTLAVKPEDAQKLSLAAVNGELRLALRNVSDDKKLQLAAATPEDLAHNSGGEDKKSDSADEATTTAPPVTAVPPIPALPAPTMPTMPETAPVVTAPVAPEPVPVEKPKKIHTLTIEDGPNVQRIKYVFDEETQSYDGAAVTRSDVESKPKPAPKPEVKPDPKPEAKPADVPLEAEKRGPRSSKTR